MPGLSIDTSMSGDKPSSAETPSTSAETGPDLEECSNGATTPAVGRPALKPPLSEVSKYFDRDGKGYLDPLEKQLRQMDSQNLGHVPVNKVYTIMSSLQNEQKQSASLLRTLEQQQRQMINMKKSIIGLCAFAVVLAVTNIGTSFAAARLAREIKVSSDTGDLSDKSTGNRVGVTSKVVNFKMMPPTDADRRRHLTTLSEISFCRDPEADEMGGFAANATNATAQTCEVVGTFSYTDMVLLHQQFCNGWPGLPGCSGGGVDTVRLECNGRISYIDDSYLDEHEPEVDPYNNLTVFPAIGKGYHGTYHAYPQNVDSYTGPPCLQDFTVGMYCDALDPEVPCFVFAALAPGTTACFGQYMRLCGNAVAYAESQA